MDPKHPLPCRGGPGGGPLKASTRRRVCGSGVRGFAAAPLLLLLLHSCAASDGKSLHLWTSILFCRCARVRACAEHGTRV